MFLRRGGLVQLTNVVRVVGVADRGQGPDRTTPKDFHNEALVGERIC